MGIDQRQKALWLSTLAFTLAFAGWTIFAVIGIRIQEDLGLTSGEFGVLIGLPVLTGSILRPWIGALCDRHGARTILAFLLVIGAFASWWISLATSYTGFLLSGLMLGIVGSSFAAGVVYVSRCFPANQQGFALGVFGMGNIGVALTKIAGPSMMIAFGWQAIPRAFAAAFLFMAMLLVLFARTEPRNEWIQSRSPEYWRVLCRPEVWRLSALYFLAFGGAVGLGMWLPTYFIEVFKLEIRAAGALGAVFSVAASAFRPLGGILSDRFGTKPVTLWALCGSFLVSGLLAVIPAAWTGLLSFTLIAFALGLAMAFIKAAVFKDVACHFPENVGVVAGMVGMIGGLGGFLFPVAFGFFQEVTGLWNSCFMLLSLAPLLLLLWGEGVPRTLRLAGPGR